MPIALIGLMDSSKLWYRSSSGAFTPGVDRPGTFCQTLYGDCTTSCSTPHEFIVLNALEDPRFASHPSVVFRPAVRSYFGVPLLSVNGHCLGTLAALDTQVRAPPSTEQLALLRDTAARVVAAFQRGVIDRKEGEDPQASVVLPSLWIDVASSDWKVVSGNKEWEDLTGVLCDTLLDSPGLFSFMTPADDEELAALKKAVKTVDRTVSSGTVVSLPSIMTPIASNGSFLQFLFALKPAQPLPYPTTTSNRSKAPAAEEEQQQQRSNTTTTTSTISGPQSDIWVAEVHARIQSAPHTCPSLNFASISSGSISVVDAGSGSAGGRKGSLSFSASGGGGGGSGTTTNTATSVDGGAPPPARRSVDRPPSENRVVRSSGGNTSSGGAGRISNNDMRIPSRLMSLQIGQCLGRGSYGTVYAGMLRDRPVAVKVIENVTGGPGAAGQMWEAQFEALLALQKQHENVVRTLDWIKEDETGEVWIVQELCDLGTLASMFKEGVLRDARTGGPDMRAVLETACDVARGMRYLHSLNVLHSDLSSNNVMLSSAAVVVGDESEREEEKKTTTRSNSRGFIAKVTDFGLSRIAGREEVQTKTVGTVSHMPPELLMNGVMGKAGDVFSFGVMLWEMYSRLVLVYLLFVHMLLKN